MIFHSAPVKVDADLSHAIDRMQPEFGAYLKRAFTNAQIRRDYIVSAASSHLILDKAFYQADNSDVVIKNLRTTRSESPRLTSIEADLMQDVLVLSVDFGALSLECEYEMINRDVMNLLPVSSDGVLNATIESTRAKGRIGYRILGDSLQATNFDLKYKIERIHLEATYSKAGEKMHSQSKRSSIEQTILKGVQREIEDYFQDKLQSQLNEILNDVSLTTLFQEDEELLRKHLGRAKARSDISNDIMDLFLTQVRKIISDWGFSQMDIQDFEKSFRFPTDSLSFFWGSFEATEGKVRNLSTLYRTGDFSIYQEGDNVTLFGPLGLRQLECDYDKYIAKVWGIGPSGKIAITTGRNSAKIRITSNGWITSIEDIDKIHSIDFKIERIDKIFVDITGLGVLSQMWSHIVSWMTALLKNRVLIFVEDIVKQQIDQYLSARSINFY
ncbi:Mite allergen, group-7 [Sergentomyia squamirostris]